jgi:hypothetical protein
LPNTQPTMYRSTGPGGVIPYRGEFVSAAVEFRATESVARCGMTG